ncbi:hypothetical protein E4U54_001560 [Claviceps lovelessii]|nr:hypothetical protein E4U54_001560 [Claviceps lovelessii]
MACNDFDATFKIYRLCALWMDGGAQAARSNAASAIRRTLSFIPYRDRRHAQISNQVKQLDVSEEAL